MKIIVDFMAKMVVNCMEELNMSAVDPRNWDDKKEDRKRDRRVKKRKQLKASNKRKRKDKNRKRYK